MEPHIIPVPDSDVVVKAKRQKAANEKRAETLRKKRIAKAR